jgi:hypothetical protein
MCIRLIKKPVLSDDILETMFNFNNTSPEASRLSKALLLKGQSVEKRGIWIKKQKLTDKI